MISGCWDPARSPARRCGDSMFHRESASLLRLLPLPLHSLSQINQSGDPRKQQQGTHSPATDSRGSCRPSFLSPDPGEAPEPSGAHGDAFAPGSGHTASRFGSLRRASPPARPRSPGAPEPRPRRWRPLLLKPRGAEETRGPRPGAGAGISALGEQTLPGPATRGPARWLTCGSGGARGGRGGGGAGLGAGRAQRRAQRPPRPRGGAPAPGLAAPARRSAALGALRRRHVFRRQRERPAAPGGAAQAGGRRGEDQGLAGSCRASTVLHAECLQGCPAGRCSSWKQPLPGAQILCFILKAVRKELTEECFQAQSDE